MFSIERRN